MPKKILVALAAALRRTKPPTQFRAGRISQVPTSPTKLEQWKLTVHEIATLCEQFNPQFNRERFLTACGM